MRIQYDSLTSRGRIDLSLHSGDCLVVREQVLVNHLLLSLNVNYLLLQLRHLRRQLEGGERGLKSWLL